MVDEDVLERSRNVFKCELQAAEEIEDLIEEYETKEIAEAMQEVVSDLVEKVEDRDREGKIYLLTHQIGQSVNSEAMAEEGAKLYREWAEE